MADLLALQTTTSAPSSSLADSTTDAINPPRRSSDLMGHFPENLYDRSAESHISRLVKALIGDAGVGGVKKAYSQKRFEESVLTSHFYDLDVFFGSLFGFKRLVSEVPDLNPYYDVADGEQWDEMHARDAGYRSRVTEFASAVSQCPTPDGLAHVAAAILGVECRIYETYQYVDENGGSNPGGSPTPAGARTYGDVEQEYRYYVNMQTGTWGDIEGGHGTFGRTTTQNRQEFIVRPLRSITAEETYHLVRVLTALKPACTLLTINPSGVEVHNEERIRSVAADSTYWEIRPKVAPPQSLWSAYPKPPTTPGTPVEQPRPAFSAYQGEAWSYNGDIASFAAYAETPENGVVQSYDFEQFKQPDGSTARFSPASAVTDQTELLLGRYVSDGILTASPLGARPVASEAVA